MNTAALIQKVWNFCHTLRDDGVSYGDYLEQLTYLLFLKMAHEYAAPPYKRDTKIPKGYVGRADRRHRRSLRLRARQPALRQEKQHDLHQ